jgi:hypothetical protein
LLTTSKYLIHIITEFKTDILKDIAIKFEITFFFKMNENRLKFSLSCLRA